MNVVGRQFHWFHLRLDMEYYVGLTEKSILDLTCDSLGRIKEQEFKVEIFRSSCHQESFYGAKIADMKTTSSISRQRTRSLAIFVLTYSPLRKEKWRMEGIGLVYPQC